MTARQWLLIIYIYLVATTLVAQDLRQAIRANDAEAVQAMLERDPAIPEGAVTEAIFINARGFIPANRNHVLHLVLYRKPKLDLHETAAVGRPEELAKMLGTGAVDVRNRFGWTPLHFAAFAGNVENVKLLLDRGADVNLRADTRFRNTPLLIATLTGQVGVAKLLLERGADVLVRQAKGFTPLHEAALIGPIDLVRLYLERGAEINSRTDDGRTPLSEALRGKQTAIAELLREKGAVAGPVGDNVMGSPR